MPSSFLKKARLLFFIPFDRPFRRYAHNIVLHSSRTVLLFFVSRFIDRFAFICISGRMLVPILTLLLVTSAFSSVDVKSRIDCHPDPDPSSDACSARGCIWESVPEVTFFMNVLFEIFFIFQFQQ